MKKAESANIGEVIVAAEDQKIIDDVKKNGGQAILTNNYHKTGTDRIFEAINKLGNKGVELVMNLQGDEPLMNIDDIKKLHNKMIQSKAQFGTLASNISEKKVLEKQSLVKVITKDSLNESNFPEAKNFKREIINETKNIYHHLGIYCYQFETLKKFISFNQSSNEIKYRLEQLRAIENGISIDVVYSKNKSFGIDTVQDYVEIKKIMEYKIKKL